MSSPPFINRLLASCVFLSQSAGDAIRKLYHPNMVRKYKNNDVKNIQTHADLISQSIIFSGLLKHFPNLKLVGEEEDTEMKALTSSQLMHFCTDVASFDDCVLGMNFPEKWRNLAEADVTVFVDPLDATKEFSEGMFECVTVLIGIAVQKEPIAGVIYQPYYGCLQENKGVDVDVDSALGRCVWTLSGIGVQGIHPRVLENYGEHKIVSTTRSHYDELVKSTMEAIGATEILRVGGCGYKVLMLLEGLAHLYVYPSPHCKFWDTCAPEAILKEAGGFFCGCNGLPIIYDHDAIDYNVKHGILAVADHTWTPQLVQQIPDWVKNKLS